MEEDLNNKIHKDRDWYRLTRIVLDNEPIVITYRGDAFDIGQCLCAC